MCVVCYVQLLGLALCVPFAAHIGAHGRTRHVARTRGDRLCVAAYPIEALPPPVRDVCTRVV